MGGEWIMAVDVFQLGVLKGGTGEEMWACIVVKSSPGWSRFLSAQMFHQIRKLKIQWNF